MTNPRSRERRAADRYPHPDVVDRPVLVSAAMRQDGFYPEVVAAFKQLEANAATFGPGVKASPLGWTRFDVP